MTLNIAWLGGNCPVQAEGTINGKPFYFRARHDHWSFEVGETDTSPPEWRHEEYFSNSGWMEEEEARALIDKAVTMYQANA